MKIVINLKGGLVDQIITDADCEIMVVDYDSDREDDPCDFEGRFWRKPDAIDAKWVKKWSEGKEYNEYDE